MGATAKGAKEKGANAKGAWASGAMVTGAQNNQETGGKGVKLMGEREMDNMLPGDTTAGQDVTEGIRRKNCSDVVIEGVTRKTRVFVGTR